MATILQSSSMDTEALTHNQRQFVYNAMDCVVTHAVFGELSLEIEKNSVLPGADNARLSYLFVRAMRGPAMDMMSRGMMIQPQVRADETARYRALRDQAQARLDALANAVWGPETYDIVTKTERWVTEIGRSGKPLKPRRVIDRTITKATRPLGLNPNSGPQMLAFFNGALKMPLEMEVRKTPQGTIRTPTANGKALRKWREIKTKGPGIHVRDPAYGYIQIAKPFVTLILAIRDYDKKLQVLTSALDPDGRFRCSYNVVGTENGRWSSSENAFGRGTNGQNISPTMRRMFCADDGWRLVSTDLEQAESRMVAGLVWQATGDDSYWRACVAGDLHTTVCRMSWPDLGWNGDPAHDRKIADRPYPDLPRFSYRDVAKRVGHGSNYRGTPYGIAMAVGIPVRIVEDFQRRYFAAFPGIPRWHQILITDLQLNQYLDTPLGRRRWFFGRTTDDSTIREAIAYKPQSTIGELLNLALYRVWQRTLPEAVQLKHFLIHNPLPCPVQLLLQNHDAFAFQIPLSADLDLILPEIKKELEIPIPLVRACEDGTTEVRHLSIPGEFVTGWNWAYDQTKLPTDEWNFADGNPDGLRKWKGGADNRRRQQPAKPSLSSWLDRPISGVHQGCR